MTDSGDLFLWVVAWGWNGVFCQGQEGLFHNTKLFKDVFTFRRRTNYCDGLVDYRPGDTVAAAGDFSMEPQQNFHEWLLAQIMEEEWQPIHENDDNDLKESDFWEDKSKPQQYLPSWFIMIATNDMS